LAALGRVAMEWFWLTAIFKLISDGFDDGAFV
jgi:hypothetical protein